MGGPSRARVLVVGGGPAGSSTALHLVRREGVVPSDVMLVDRAVFPRDKPCAGAISRFGVEILEGLGVAMRVPSVSISGLRVLDGGRASATRRAIGVVVRRSEWDASLLEEVRASGVRVQEDTAVTGVARVAGGFEVATSRGPIRCDLLAACDGTASGVRRALGLREPARKGHLYVLESPLTAHDEAVRDGLCDFDLSVREDGLEGYYWDFPTLVDGRPSVNRGIYHANLTALSHVKAALGLALSRRGVRLADVHLRPFSTRPYLARSLLTVPGIAFVGEAAGIDWTTGEGIAQALAMGALAAQSLAAAAARGTNDVTSYARALHESTVGRHLRQSAWFAPRVYGPHGAPFRRLLLASPAARDAGARWYMGEQLSMREKLFLGARLARELVTEPFDRFVSSKVADPAALDRAR